VGGIGLLMLGLLVLSVAQNSEGELHLGPRVWLQLLLAAGLLCALASIGFAQPVYLLVATGVAFTLQLAVASERVAGGH